MGATGAGLDARAARRREIAALREEAVVAGAAVVSTPRQPSASWLYGLSQRRTVLVASGGTRMLAVQVCVCVCVCERERERRKREKEKEKGVDCSRGEWFLMLASQPTQSVSSP